MSKPQDRRDFLRAPFHSLARLTGTGGIAREGWLQDISLKGALLEMLDDWPGVANEQCRLQLDLSPEVTIRMDATVIHVTGRHLGLRCNKIDIDSITALRRLMELNSGNPDLLERELPALAPGN